MIFNVNWLGDVLFSTAAIRNIRYNFPEAYIACAIPPRCSEVLEGNPHLDEIILFDERGRHKSFASKAVFIRELSGRKFTRVFLFHRSFSRALICFLAGIPVRAGHYTRKRGSLLTTPIPFPDLSSLHRIDAYLTVVSGAGLSVRDRFPEFVIEDRHCAEVDSFFKANPPGRDVLIGINPGGNWQPKRWQPEKFSELGDRLAGEFQADIIITGAEKDAPLAGNIASRMKHRPLIACGKFSLKEFGALCRFGLDLFITADSGPLHIANASGAPRIIALFGPTDPALTGPVPADRCSVLRKNVGCAIPCYNLSCEKNRCMEAISVEDVAEEARRMLGRPS